MPTQKNSEKVYVSKIKLQQSPECNLNRKQYNCKEITEVAMIEHSYMDLRTILNALALFWVSQLLKYNSIKNPLFYSQNMLT